MHPTIVQSIGAVVLCLFATHPGYTQTESLDFAQVAEFAANSVDHDAITSRSKGYVGRLLKAIRKKAAQEVPIEHLLFTKLYQEAVSLNGESSMLCVVQLRTPELFRKATLNHLDLIRLYGSALGASEVAIDLRNAVSGTSPKATVSLFRKQEGDPCWMLFYEGEYIFRYQEDGLKMYWEKLIADSTTKND